MKKTKFWEINVGDRFRHNGCEFMKTKKIILANGTWMNAIAMQDTRNYVLTDLYFFIENDGIEVEDAGVNAAYADTRPIKID